MRAGPVGGDPVQAAPGGRRSWLTSPAAARTVAVLVLLLASAVVPLSLLARQDVLGNAAQALIVLPICAVGLIVARRQPGNPIGWLLLAVPVGVLLSLDAGPYG